MGGKNTRNIGLSFLLSFLYTVTKKNQKQPRTKPSTSFREQMPLCYLVPLLLSPASSAVHPCCQRGFQALRFTEGDSPLLLLVEKSPCTSHATSKIGSCYYETPPKSSRWHCRGVSRNSINIPVCSIFSRRAVFITQFAIVCYIVTDLGSGIKSR